MKEEKFEKAIAAPFSGSFEQQAIAAGICMKIDIEKLEKEAGEHELYPVLQSQIKRYRKLIEKKV